MQGTIDQVPGAVPRGLADFIDDARRAVWPLPRQPGPSPSFS
jgi:hypothetical protein